MIKLTIDVGNTNTLFCFFFSTKVTSVYIISSKDLSNNKLSKIINEKKIDKNFKKFPCIIISSVVPDVDKILKAFFEKKSWVPPGLGPFMNPSLFWKKSIVPVVPLYRGSDPD